jgi:large subunit ribosomal protein L19
MSNEFIRKVTLDKHAKMNPVDFTSGDTVEVYVKVKEGEKERVQKYRGIVTKIQGSAITRAFTVRKMSSGVGVERTFPFASPSIEKVEIIAKGQVRRSRLFYLRGLIGKKARIISELVGDIAATAPVAGKAATTEKAAE